MSKIIQKSNYILLSSILAFVGAYILFSSLSTSLGFKIDQITQTQNEAKEEYEQLLSSLAQSQGKDYLAKASLQLKLVEVNLTAGYLDIRPRIISAVDSLAVKP